MREILERLENFEEFRVVIFEERVRLSLILSLILSLSLCILLGFLSLQNFSHPDSPIRRRWLRDFSSQSPFMTPPCIAEQMHCPFAASLMDGACVPLCLLSLR